MSPKAPRSVVFLVLALLAVLAGAAYGQVTYQVDDGTAEESVGLTTGGYIWWANGFTVQPGGETITSIQIAFGGAFSSSLPVGAPFTVMVYDDSDDDGDPSTGTLTLVGSADGNVIDPNTGTFQNVALSAPAAVSGGFFIAATMQHNVGMYPMSLDTNAPAGASWIGYSSTTPIDINDPVGTMEFLDTMNDIGFPGNSLLRAEGEPPAPVPALPAWGVLALVLTLVAVVAAGLRRRISA